MQQILLKVDVDRDVVAALETHEAELRGRRRRAGPGALLPVRRARRAPARLHARDRRGDAGAARRARLPRGRSHRRRRRRAALGELPARPARLAKGRARAHARAEPRGARGERYLEEPRRLEPIPGRDISLTIDIELEQADRARDARPARRRGGGGRRAHRAHPGGAVASRASTRTWSPAAAARRPSRDAFRRSERRSAEAHARQDHLRRRTRPARRSSRSRALAALAERPDRSAAREVDCRGGYEFGRRYFRCTGVHRRRRPARGDRAVVQHLLLRARRARSASTGWPRSASTSASASRRASASTPRRAAACRRAPGTRAATRRRSAAASRCSPRSARARRTVTVLQLALAYAALANGGTLYQPQVVRSVETSDGTVVQEFPPRVRRMVERRPGAPRADQATRSTASSTETEGTAYKERIEGVDMAGKTGTAQVSHVTPRGVDPGQGLVLQPRPRLVRRLRAGALARDRDRRPGRARRRRRQERGADRDARRARLAEAQGEAR